jgi:DNA-binding MarR family transcriptional regulator
MKKKTTPPSTSIGWRIGRLQRAAHVYFKHRFGELGLGHAQGITLHHICRQDGIDQLALLNKVRLDKSSLTSQLKKLEENGYIVRKSDPADRRAKRIFITDKTRALQDDLHDIFASWTKILTEGLVDTERETLIRLLDTLQDNASKTLKEMRAHEETE